MDMAVIAQDRDESLESPTQRLLRSALARLWRASRHSSEVSAMGPLPAELILIKSVINNNGAGQGAARERREPVTALQTGLPCPRRTAVHQCSRTRRRVGGWN